MEEMLSQLRLASGMPFGMLFILVSLVGLAFIGVVGALRLRRRTWRIAAAGVALLAATRLALGIASEVLVQEDLNPVVRPSELVGSWRDGAQVLALHAATRSNCWGRRPERERGNFTTRSFGSTV